MTVKTSEDVYKFVKDCIKIKEEIEDAKKIKKKEKNVSNLKSNLSKYNFDYSKFENCIREIEDEEEEKEKIEKKKLDYINNNHPCSHDHSKERQLYEKDSKEKIIASNAFNEEGKKAFYEKNYKLACVYFRKGLIQLDYSFPDSEQERNEQNKLEINLHLNIALTNFHMSKYYECINECSTVLNLDKNNIKAYYRKGQAYMCLDLYNEAKIEFLKVLEIDPNDNNAKKSLLTLKKKIEIYNKKKKLVCSKMFSFNENKENTIKYKQNETNDIDNKIYERNYEKIIDKNNHEKLTKNDDNLKKMDKNKSIVRNSLNKMEHNISHISLTKERLFEMDITNFFKECFKSFLIYNISFYIFICFSIFLFLLIYIFTTYKIFLTFSSLLSIFFFISFLFIYSKKHKH